MNMPTGPDTQITELAILALQEADTEREWKAALALVWLASESEAEFEVTLIDHVDESDAAIAGCIEAMRDGDLQGAVTWLA